jgi:hypothetical protein
MSSPINQSINQSIKLYTIHRPLFPPAVTVRLYRPQPTGAYCEDCQAGLTQSDETRWLEDLSLLHHTRFNVYLNSTYHHHKASRYAATYRIVQHDAEWDGRQGKTKFGCHSIRFRHVVTTYIVPS